MLLTRYKITVLVLLFLAFMSMVAAIKSMEALSITCVTGMMTTLSTYLWAQTKRPSNEIVDQYIKEREQEREGSDYESE